MPDCPTFSNTKIKPSRAISGRNLVDVINEGKADVITTIINKFNTAEKVKTKVDEKDIFILVDESHRSNYGELATKMRRVFPNACYIGFTGTPLMKNDKTVIKFGGNYIHKYTNDEIGNTRDVDENGLLGIIDAGDLKVPEEETGSVSNEDSSVNSSDNEDPEIDLVEEVRITFELKVSKIYSICALIYFGTKRNNNSDQCYL